MQWLLVGIGGALGSMLRHGLNRLIHQQNLSATFPAGIFVVNITGSIIIGVLSGVIVSGRWSPNFNTRTFLIVGVLGGFTTFSSFSLDTLALFREGHLAQAAGNVLGQVSLSLLGVWVGFKLGGRI
jgi:fluoride exporter